jgi:hypothetical protein
MVIARPSCLRLFWQVVRMAAIRTFWTAGRSRPISTAMMAITTSSSTSVKPRRGEPEDMEGSCFKVLADRQEQVGEGPRHVA